MKNKIVVLAVVLGFILVFFTADALADVTVLETPAYTVDYPGSWSIETKRDFYYLTNSGSAYNGYSEVYQFTASIDADESEEQARDNWYNWAVESRKVGPLSDGVTAKREDVLVDGYPGILLTHIWIQDGVKYTVFSGSVLIDQQMIVIDYLNPSADDAAAKDIFNQILASVKFKRPSVDNTKVVIKNKKNVLLNLLTKSFILVELKSYGVVRSSLVYKMDKTDIVSAEWGDWNYSMIPLRLNGKKVGSTLLNVYLKDMKEVSDSVIITVTPFDISDKSQYSEKEFTFRGIPWGSSFNAVNEELGMSKYDWTSMEDDAKVSVLDRVFYASDGESYKDFLGKYYWNVNPDGITVAGHKIDSIWLYCAYSLDDNRKIVSDDDYNKLYFARYDVVVRDLEKDYGDLLSKLVELYGEPIQRGNIDSLFIDNCYCSFWMGANSTFLCLVKGMNTIGDEESIVLSYGTLSGNEWLLEAYNSLLTEESEIIKTSVEGL